MITLAIDGSTKATGVAVFNEKELVYYTCIKSSSTNMLKRVKIMTDELEKICNKYNPDQIIMEQIIPDNLNDIAWRTNQKTFKALFYLQGSIVMMFFNHGKEVDFIEANSWRSKCGIKTGAGIKRETLKQKDIEFVKNTYNLTVDDDIADAIGIGHSKVHSLPEPKPFNWE